MTTVPGQRERGVFDLRVAGGKAVLINARLPLVAVQARLLARRGYRCWVREKNRASATAGLCVVTKVDQAIVVELVDDVPAWFQGPLQSAINQLESDDPLPNEEHHHVRADHRHTA